MSSLIKRSVQKMDIGEVMHRHEGTYVIHSNSVNTNSNMLYQKGRIIRWN